MSQQKIVVGALIAAAMIVGMASCGGGGGGGGTTGPVSVNTLDGATDIPVDSTFQYTFSSAVDTATVDTSTYFIVPTPAATAAQTRAAIDEAICDSTNALAAAVACSNFTQCTLDPAEDLEGGTSYTVCLNTDIDYLGGGAFEGFMATFTSSGDVNAPSLEAIRTALSENNPYGIVPNLTLGAITLPACTTADGTAIESGITYAMSDLPAWLSFDATTRALSLTEGTTVPQDALTASEVTYGCTSGTASAQIIAKAATNASQTFTVNDLDGGGVVDGYEYEFGEVPLAGNTGWFWLTPGNIGIYRSGTDTPKMPTGINVVSDGMDPTDASDDTSDFDGDTLANNTEVTNMTNIFVATSDGTFGTAVTYTTGDGTGGIATGDLDGDGDLDLVKANRDTGSSTISVLPGDGDGTFGTKTDYAGARPFDVGLADVDGDGDLDIVSVNFNAATISIYLNNGSGTFATAVDYAKAEANGRLALGDFDADGDVDIAATNGIYSPTTNLSVLLGNGDGTFATKVDYTVGDVPQGVTVADLDGDGDLDVVVANNNSASLSVLLGNGDGTFAAKTDYNLGANPSDVVAADFDGDGNVDVAVIITATNSVTIVPGSGDGTLDVDNKVSYTAAAALAPGRLAVADLDGDGDVDLAYTIDGGGAGDTVEVRFNDGSGAFGAATSYTVSTRPTFITAGDFNNDGKLDLANSHFSTDTAAVILNQ